MSGEAPHDQAPKFNSKVESHSIAFNPLPSRFQLQINSVSGEVPSRSTPEVQPPSCIQFSCIQPSTFEDPTPNQLCGRRNPDGRIFRRGVAPPRPHAPAFERPIQLHSTLYLRGFKSPSNLCAAMPLTIRLRNSTHPSGSVVRMPGRVGAVKPHPNGRFFRQGSVVCLSTHIFSLLFWSWKFG